MKHSVNLLSLHFSTYLGAQYIKNKVDPVISSLFIVLCQEELCGEICGLDPDLGLAFINCGF